MLAELKASRDKEIIQLSLRVSPEDPLSWKTVIY